MTASANANTAPTPSRREFLNYAFGASIALMLAGSCGGLVWFLQQQGLHDEEHGYFRVDSSIIPKVGQAPISLAGNRFWLARFDMGLVVYWGACPYRGCFLRWSPSNERFECPCCGSKFQFDGTHIDGPAQRDLDRVVVTVTTDHGTFTTSAEGSPVLIDGMQPFVLNANYFQRIVGKPRPPRLT